MISPGFCNSHGFSIIVTIAPRDVAFDIENDAVLLPQPRANQSPLYPVVMSTLARIMAYVEEKGMTGPDKKRSNAAE